MNESLRSPAQPEDLMTLHEAQEVIAQAAASRAEGGLKERIAGEVETPRPPLDRRLAAHFTVREVLEGEERKAGPSSRL